MRIKKNNEWKAVFIMYIGAYKLIVMYFELTNSLVIFQTMINNLFQDMINQRNTVTFIDDIIVATNTKKEHDKLVIEILRKLKKNNLFVKPEKYQWKIKKVEFLDMIIGP